MTAELIERLREKYEQWCAVNCSHGGASSEFYWRLFLAGAESVRGLDNARLQQEVEALRAELDEASPKRKCDRCGEEFRMHQLIYEEGDELECLPCNARLNARQYAIDAAIDAAKEGA